MQNLLSLRNDSLPLAHALRQWFPCGRTGKSVHISTGIRWIHQGVIGPNGDRVKLSAIKVGGTTYIRAKDAEQFLLALNAGMSEPVTQAETEADIKRRAAATTQALSAFGI